VWISSSSSKQENEVQGCKPPHMLCAINKLAIFRLVRAHIALKNTTSLCEISQEVVDHFRLRIAADIIRGDITICDIEEDDLDKEKSMPPNYVVFIEDDHWNMGAAGEISDYQQESQDEALEKQIGIDLGSLASSREKIKEEIFKNILRFRNTRTNGIRKLNHMKREFHSTFLRLSSSSGACDWPKLKKKCGKYWACIEYAIFESVGIASFSCSHLERMRSKHQEDLLSGLNDEKSSHLELNSKQFEKNTKSLLQVYQVIMPVDDEVTDKPIRKSDRLSIISSVEPVVDNSK
jgi:hypothetical protein